MSEVGRERALIVVFLGPVGSGKSTHMKILEEWLLHRGYSVKRFFIKSFHLASHLLLDLLLSNAMCRLLLSRPCKRWEVLYRFRGTSFLRFLVFFDAFFSLVLVVAALRLVAKRYSVVLVEEYLYGSLADYLYLLSLSGQPNRYYVKLVTGHVLKLLNSLPPALVFYFDADTDTLKRRWIERGSDVERGEYLEMQRSLLPVLVRLTGAQMVYVDTVSKTIEEVNRALRARIARLL